MSKRFTSTVFFVMLDIILLAIRGIATATDTATTFSDPFLHSVQTKHTIVKERSLQIVNKNIVTATLEKSLITVNQPVVCSLSSTVPVDFSRNSYKIISSNQLHELSSIKDVTDYYNGILNGGWDDTSARISFNFDWEKLLGPRVGYDTTTNISVVENWKDYGPFHIVHINRTAGSDVSTVLGVSEPFYVGFEPVQQLQQFASLKDSYYPGQEIVLNVTAEYYESYYKIYKVNSSYKDDPYIFNSATMVHVSTITCLLEPSTHQIHVDWTIPGLYQMVMFTKYSQIIAVSDVFTLNRVDSLAQSVTTDLESYYAGQNLTLTISRPNGTLFDSNIAIALIPANQSLYQSSIQDEPIIYTRQWDKSESIMEFLLPLSATLSDGPYKIISYIGSSKISNAIRLGVSKEFQIQRTLIQITMPKRNITQGETINFNVYTPYFDMTSYETTYTGYRFAIVSWNYDPDNNKTNGILNTYYQKNDVFNGTITLKERFNNLDPGTYRFALLYYTQYDQTVLYTIPNTTFRLERNNFILTTDKNRYQIGDKMSISLTTSKKVPLFGIFGSWFHPGSINVPPYYKYVSIQNEQNETYPSSVINETTIVDWPIPGEYQIRVYLSYNNFVYSDPFTINKQIRINTHNRMETAQKI
jgi:hypothetical protein